MSSQLQKARSAARRVYDPLDPSQQHEPTQAGALVEKYLNTDMAHGMSSTRRALMLWRRVAGTRIAKHTLAVWVSEPKKPDENPDLVVYLDGNALMADLTTNAELYIDHLAYVGFPVHSIKFRLSRKAGTHTQSMSSALNDSYKSAVQSTRTAIKTADIPASLPPLSHQEEEQVESACAPLPDKLRESASKAMKLSLRRDKASTT